MAETSKQFRSFAAGQGLSQFGSQLSMIAVPTYAATTMNFSAGSMGILYMLGWVPPLLLGLTAGKLADRSNKLSLMVAADIISVLSVGLLSLFMWYQAQSAFIYYFLVVVAAGAGTFYGISSASFVPLLLIGDVRRRGNGLLSSVTSFASLIGQILSAFILHFATTALSLLIDAITFLLRICIIVTSVRVKQNDPAPKAEKPAAASKSPSDDSVIKIMTRNPQLAAIIGAQASLNGGGAFIVSYFLIYAFRDLGISPTQLSIMLALGHVFSIFGAQAAPKVANERNTPIAAFLSLIGAVGAMWLIYVAQWTPAFGTLILYQCLFGFFSSMFTVISTTWRQDVTPMAFQGRVASWTFVLGYLSLIAGSGLATVISPLIDASSGIVVGCAISTTTLLWYFLIRRGLAKSHDSSAA
jgi:Na+/melibiose symporter-like transporter